MTANTCCRTAKGDVPIYRSYRYAIGASAFFGFFFVYALRVNFSVAIVCMIKVENSTVNSTEDISNSTCKRLDGSQLTYEGEFDWNQSTKSKLLASFFYGYIVTQIPGGWLARRFGAKIVMTVGMLTAAVSTLLMPVCARASIYLVYILRIIAGLATGMLFPAAQCLWGRWIPPNERSRIPAIVYTGPTMGTLVTLAISGIMCEYGFDGGWPSIFYISGLATFVWLVSWIYLVYNTPNLHPRISMKEKKFIARSIGDSYHDPEGGIQTPWLQIFKSRAVWAVIIAHICSNWTQYTLITALPSYMNDVLKFDIKSNGLFSSIPYIAAVITAPMVARGADCIQEMKYLSTANTRRIIQSTGYLGLSVFMILTGFVTCEVRMTAVAFLTLAVAFKTFNKCGFLVNHLDFAPRFAGELLGITNTFGTLPGMIAPIVNGALTPNGTREEWQTVFYLCAGFAIVGTVVFDLLVKGEFESWAKPRGVMIEITANSKKSDEESQGEMSIL